VCGSEKLNRQARKIIHSYHRKTHANAIEVSAGFAGALLRTNQTEAEELLFEILETKEKVFGRQNPQYARTLCNPAFLMNNRKRFSEGEKFSEQILALRKDFINDENPVISAALQMSVIALMGTGEAEKAEPFLRESPALRKKLSRKITGFWTLQKVSWANVWHKSENLKKSEFCFPIRMRIC
jgi:hypothetical protein